MNKIPKRIIIYKAKRHYSNFPVDIKYRSYTNKIFLAIDHQKLRQYPSLLQRYQKKMVQRISLNFPKNKEKELFQVFKLFSKFSCVKKFSIVLDGYRDDEKMQNFQVKSMKRLFKNLKRIRQFDINQLSRFQGNYRLFKAMTLLNSLESLSLGDLTYSTEFNMLRPLIQVAQLVSKRGCWPNLKLLEFRRLCSDDFSNAESEPDDKMKCLQNLLALIQELEACKGLGNCLNFHLTLPDTLCRNGEQPRLVFNEISKITSSMTDIAIPDLGCFSEALHNFLLDAKNIRKLFLDLSGNLNEEINLRALKNISTLKKLTLALDGSRNAYIPLYEDAMIQVKNLCSLTDLELKFSGTLSLTDEFVLELAQALSSLSELKSLKLCFEDVSKGRDAFLKLGSHLCFEEIFQAITQKTKLQKLSLLLPGRNLNNSSSLFKNFFKNLRDLSSLSVLHFSIDCPESLGDEEVLELAKSISKLKKLQNFKLEITKKSGQSFESETFEFLIDMISENLFMLSELWLTFGKFGVNGESCQRLIYKLIWTLKSLDSLELHLGGKIKGRLNTRTITNEIHKRMSGQVVLSKSI